MYLSELCDLHLLIVCSNPVAVQTSQNNAGWAATRAVRRRARSGRRLGTGSLTIRAMAQALNIEHRPSIVEPWTAGFE